MRNLLLIGLVLLLAVPVVAVQNVSYSWEDGGTTLCNYGANLVGVANVSGPQAGIYYTAAGVYSSFTTPGACDGNSYLHVAEDPHTGTPSEVVALVSGLQIGDVINATICLYDPFDGSSTFPGQRLYGAFTLCEDPCFYEADATDQPVGYTAAEGWYTFTWTFTYDDADDPNGCYRIEVRQYSYPVTLTPAHTDYFIDNIRLEIPDHASVEFPEGQSPVETKTWSTIKALYR